jgi:hypothetical protein
MKKKPYATARSLGFFGRGMIYATCFMFFTTILVLIGGEKSHSYYHVVALTALLFALHNYERRKLLEERVLDLEKSLQQANNLSE